MTEATIGVIGGSGLYEMEGLTEVEEVTVETPFGSPSDRFVIGSLEGQRVAFLPRHGRHHTISPSEIDNRANLWAMRKLGVRYLLSVNACGSLREDHAPGHIVIPDQLVDRTRARAHTFFEGGVVAHVGTGEPFDPELSRRLADAVEETGATVHRGGTFVIIEGPRFSTKAESRIFRQWGCSIIGMTTIPEAFLAREAEMAYASMAHVTDYDVWHETEEDVSVEAVIATLRANVEVAKEAVRGLVRRLADRPDSPAHHALASAIISPRRRDAVPEATWERLGLFLEPYYA